MTYPQSLVAGAALLGLFFALPLSAQSPTPAEEPAEVSESQTADIIPIAWFQPRRSNESEILFMGKTLPLAKLYLLNPYITRVEGDESTQIFLEEGQVLNLPSQAAEDGIFSFQFLLSEDGRYEADVVFVHPEESYRKSTSFKLAFEIKNQAISLWAAEVNLDEKVDSDAVERNLKRTGVFLFSEHSRWISLSLGTTLLSYDKKAPALPMDASVSSTQNSYFQLRYEKRMKSKVLVSLDAFRSSGRVSSGPEVQVADGQYQWMRFRPQVTFYPTAWVVQDTPRLQIRGALVGGLDYEVLPFLRSINNFAEQEMSEAQLLTGFLGVHFDYRRHQDWKFWGRLVLHTPPIVLGSPYEIHGSLATDLSAGLDYVLPDRRWSIGPLLEMHWRKLATFEEDVFLAQVVDTDQNFLTYVLGLKVTHAF